jgi:hypothetical protein
MPWWVDDARKLARREDHALGECADWSSVVAGKPKSPRSPATRVGVCDLGAGARGNRASLMLHRHRPVVV